MKVGFIPVIWAVDHGAGYVLVHEEQQRETEAETHSTENRRPL